MVKLNSNKCNVGYGFVNMTSPEATWRLYKAFHLQLWEAFNSRKICEVTYARVQVIIIIMMMMIFIVIFIFHFSCNKGQKYFSLFFLFF